MATDQRGRPVYKVRRQGGNSYAIQLPNEIASYLEDKEFAFELTETGFSFEFLKEPLEEGLPEWFREALLGDDS